MSKGQGWRSTLNRWINAEIKNVYLQNGNANQLQTWYTDGAGRVEDPYHRHMQWPPRSEVQFARSHAPSDSCWLISWEKVPAKPKVLRRLPTPFTIRFVIKWFKVIRPINAEIKSVSYLPNGKAYELQSWYTDGALRPISPTSAMTFKVKGQGRKVMWSVCQLLAH